MKTAYITFLYDSSFICPATGNKLMIKPYDVKVILMESINFSISKSFTTTTYDTLLFA